MHKKIHIVSIQALVAHERVSQARVMLLQSRIRACGVIQRPVVVDKDSGVILDGHHRIQALKALGALKAPVLYVHYKNKDVRVYVRRKELLMDMVKRLVVSRALSHTLFPIKTTRHIIRLGRRGRRIRLADLMK